MVLMKKLLSILLCLVMMFGLLGLTASAQGKNLCEEFKTVEWFEACFNIPETDNSSFFNEKIIYNFLCNRITHDEAYSNKYTFTDNFAQVPEADFEGILNKNFSISSTTISKLKGLKLNDYEISSEGTPVYNNGFYTFVVPRNANTIITRFKIIHFSAAGNGQQALTVKRPRRIRPAAAGIDDGYFLCPSCTAK